jgi:hypothetical protein
MVIIERLINWARVQLPSAFLLQLDQNFKRINDVLNPYIVTEFIDTTSASVSRYLPDGNLHPDKEYHYTKTDSSANTVTIYSFSGQYVQGAASLTITTQGDSAHLSFNRASQTWWLM